MDHDLLDAAYAGKRILGTGAERHGYVVFSLANGHWRSGRTRAAYVIVMDLYGRVVAARTGESYTLATTDDDDAGVAYSSRFETVKAYNSSTLLLVRRPLAAGTYRSARTISARDGSSCCGTGEPESRSRRARRRPRSRQPTSRSSTIWPARASAASRSSFRPTTRVAAWKTRVPSGVSRWAFRWRTACEAHFMGGARSDDDVRSFCATAPQFTHVHAAYEGPSNKNSSAAGELMLYLSARALNAVVKVRRADGVVLWVLGGTFSDFEAQHSDGASNSSRADSLFYGQWSAEPLADGTLGSNGRESRRRLGRKRQERIEALMGGLTVDDYLDDADDDDRRAPSRRPRALEQGPGLAARDGHLRPASGSLLLFDNGFDSERDDFRRRSRRGAVVTWDTTTMRAHVSWAWTRA